MANPLSWFDSSDYMPHGMCYLWEPGIMSLHVVSDVTIGLAYFSIPALLFHVVRKRGDESYTFLARLFALFIVLCGATHFFAVYAVWVPEYMVDGLLKAATAIVSVWTAIVLWRLAPQLIALPSPDSLQKANAELRREIAERQRIERERDFERQRNQRILQAASDGLLALDDQGRVMFTNPAARRILRLPSLAILGQDAKGLLDLDDGQEQQHPIDLAMAGKQAGAREMSLRHVDGGKLQVLITVTPMTPGDEDDTMRALICLSDITDRKLAQDNLVRAQRMESLGQLAGGLAHDFNNLLMVVSGNIELLARRLQDLPDARGRLDQILRAVRRGAALTNRLLVMSRRHDSAPTRVDPNVILDDLSGVLGSTLGEAVTLILEVPARLPHIIADPAEFEASLVNLALNARDAMAEQGRLTIAARRRILGQDEPSAPADLPPGNYLEIVVSDTGPGIRPEVLEHMFEPFFTTKERGQGSGLGLTMVHAFAIRAGGAITVDSTPGKGTAFHLFIPSVEDDMALSAAEAAPDMSSGNVLVLVVEDQHAVREMTTAMLEELGYRVIASEDGATALEMLAATPEVAILLTDVIMPGGLTGPDVARKALRMRPDLKIVFCSGYASDKLREFDDLPGGALSLRKPFRLSELSRMMHLALTDGRD